MRAARRLAARAQAVELAAVAELARRRYAEEAEPRHQVLSPAEYLHDEVAQALTLTSTAADDLIRFATELTERLPGTFTALSTGAIDYSKARTLWHGTDRLSPAVAATIEAYVLPKAPAQTTGEIRAKIRRLVKKLDPHAVERRRVAAQRRRGLHLIETDDGTTHLTGTDLSTEAASAAYGRVNAIATALKSDGDLRNIDQLRADVYLALLRGTPTTSQQQITEPSDIPTGQQQPAGWSGTDDALADAIAQAARTELTTLSEQRGEPDVHCERQHQLDVLIARAAERISESLVDLKTCTPDHDRPGYRPPPSMRRLIEHRDRRCGYSGCRRPARHCDADHSIPHQRGGPTCPCNLALLCRRHHRMKQARAWRVHHIWPGVILWITPTGHWSITAPADRE